MLCSVAVSGVMLQTVPDLDRKKKQAWTEEALNPPLSTGPASPAGAALEEHLLQLLNATTAGLLLDICTCWFVSVYIWSQNVRRLNDSLLPHRLWRACRGVWQGQGREGPVLLFLSSPLTAAGMEAWLEGLLLPQALAGPAGVLKNALLCRCLGRYVADCA